MEGGKLLTIFKNVSLLCQIIYVSTVTLVICLVVLNCTYGDTPGPIVIVGGSRFEVDVANEPPARIQGLSGRKNLSTMSGMLFVFETGKAANFWMKGMKFDLDFIWIGENCRVVDTTLNVPFPILGTTNNELEIYRSEVPATYVLEVNAGTVKRLRINTEDKVRFVEISAIGADC